MYLECYACSQKGNFRENNEVNLYLDGEYLSINHNDKVMSCKKKINDDLFIAGVFDGLGGEEKGEEASYKAASALSKYNNDTDIKDFFKFANNEVCGIEKSDSSKQIGSTAVILFFRKSGFFVANIGDSRIYHIRGNNVTMLSKDHTMIETMIASGVITREDAAKSPYKNCLTQCLGMSENEILIDPYISDTYEAEIGDAFVICSDGLTGVMSDAEILSFLSENEKNDNIAEQFVNAAYERGAKDNTTVIVIYVKKENNALGEFIKKLGL